jgi:hypothetical protein
VTPTREAIVLPALFLTVALAGGLQFQRGTMVAPPPLFALVLAMLLVGAIVQSGTLAPERLLNPARSALANANGLSVLLALFLGSAQAFAVVMPTAGVPAVLMGILLFVLVAQALAMQVRRDQLLRGLMVTFAAAFTLKFVVLAALSTPATGGLARFIQLVFEGVTLGSITQPSITGAAGYVAFATLILYLFGLVLLPSREAGVGLRRRALRTSAAGLEVRRVSDLVEQDEEEEG